MSKAFFFDIDGTTYIHDIHDSPESTKYTLKKLKENGNKMFICTSRTYEEMIHLPKEYVDVMDGIVCACGALLLVDAKVVEASYLDQEVASKVTKYLDDHHLAYRYNGVDGVCHLNFYEEESGGLFNKLYQMTPVIKDYAGEPLIHILYYTRSMEDRKNIYEMAPNFEHIDFGWGNELMAPGVNKASGMLKMAKRFGYNQEDVIAFGDGVNDISMIEAASVGIAMGNARQAVKDAADYVADDVRNDGLYKACVHFGWVEEQEDEK